MRQNGHELKKISFGESSQITDLSQCIENERRCKYNAPVSPETDVPLMFTKIQKLTEQDKLSLMRKEVKMKKMIFSELPQDFVLFKQYNITTAQMLRTFMRILTHWQIFQF